MHSRTGKSRTHENRLQAAIQERANVDLTYLAQALHRRLALGRQISGLTDKRVLGAQFCAELFKCAAQKEPMAPIAVT